MAGVQIASNGAGNHRAAGTGDALQQAGDQQLVDGGRQRTPQRSAQQQDQRQQQRAHTAQFVAVRAENQLADAQTEQPGGQAELRGGGGGIQLTRHFRQGGQVEIGAQRPQRGQQAKHDGVHQTLSG